MKKAKRVTPKQDDADLRRWCIEQAMRWPSPSPYPGAQGGQLGYQPHVDILGRAASILKWVKGE